MTLMLLLACTKAEIQETAPPYTAEPKPEGGQVVTLSTRDGVDIAADYYAASGDDRPLVVFVHMDPTGSWNRDNWPGEVLQPLVDADYHLMVIDRRGAGDSTGVASEAFETVKGAYDIEAAVLGVDGFSELMLVGASNGTTSVLDYAALAGTEGWTAPSAFVMLSAVGATTNNHAIADMPALPGWFGYPASEADNNAPWQEADPGEWSFTLYDPGAHGTRMFAEAPDCAPELTAWLIGQEG